MCKARIKWETEKKTDDFEKERMNTKTLLHRRFFACLWCWHIIIIIPRLPSIYPSILVGFNGNKWRPYFHLQFYMYATDKLELQKHLFANDTDTRTHHSRNGENALQCQVWMRCHCCCTVPLEKKKKTKFDLFALLSILFCSKSSKNSKKN